MVSSNNNLIKILQKYRDVIDRDDYESNVSIHRSIYDDLIEKRRNVSITTFERMNRITEESQVLEQSWVREGEEGNQEREAYISQLVSKLNKYQAENQSIMKKSRQLES